MTIRDEIIELVKGLPENQLPELHRHLRSLRGHDDALARFLAAAPEDDEPSTPEQDRAAAAARAAFERGERISGEEIKRTLLG